MSDWECYCDHCTGYAETPPEPCQYCSVMSGVLKEHDGTCDTLTKERWIELTTTDEAQP